MILRPGPISILRFNDPDWERRLSDVPRDVYHTAGFHAHARESGEGEPYLVIVGSREQGMAWPYLLRRVADVPGLADSDATDVTSVYGYPGPLAWGCRPGDPFVEEAWGEIVSVWRQQRAVAAFTRFNPLLGNASLISGIPRPVGGGAVAEGVIPGGLTVSIDLTQDAAAVWAGYARDVRSDVAASRRAGLTTTEDEGWEALGTFARLYRETMTRTGADDYYFWDEDHFIRLRHYLEGRLHLLVTRLGDHAVAAGLFTEFDGFVQTYLVGIDQSYIQSRSPYKVLIDDARLWAQERGNRVLHLGGGLGSREDSLFWFKSRFSPKRNLFHTGRWILDRTGYGELLAARRVTAAGQGAADPNFFPQYRTRITHADKSGPVADGN